MTIDGVRRQARLLILLGVLVLGGAGPVAAEVFCDAAGKDPRFPMPVATALPYGAVGYLDNGCTATLVSQRHVVTAAHCLAQSWSNGAWQRKLTFSPNFNTSTTPAYYEVDRVVVGTRADSGARLDWGIAHLAKPVAGFPFMKIGDPPAAPFRVTNAGYGRDLNRVSKQPTPSGAPCLSAFCKAGGNTWWDNALVQAGCRVESAAGNTVTTDCAVVGGNSGSPLFRSVPIAGTRSFDYEIVGTISNGGPGMRDYQGKQQSPPCIRRAASSPLNEGASSRGFRYVPYFASGVAVVPYAAKSKRSVVVAADSDASRFVVRERTGSKLSDGFSDYRFSSFLLKPTALTGLVQPDGNPALAAIAVNGKLFVRLGAGGDDWDHWREISRPPGVAKLVDVDALEGGAGELYVVASDGRAFRRRMEGASWGPWLALPGSGYNRVSAVRRFNGQRLAFLLRPNGTILLSQGTSSWAGTFKNAVPFAATLKAKLADVDAVTDAQGVLNVFGVDMAGGLWTRTTAGKSASWLDWGRWVAQLLTKTAAKEENGSPAAQKYGFWPETAGPNLDGVTSLTATRWLEQGTSSVANTAVFATDRDGNLYSTGYSCKTSAKPASCFWSGWRTFTQ